MTKITIYSNTEKKCVGFDACGHAGYADAGEDVVCAAISVLTINTINAIETLTSQRFDIAQDERDGKISFRRTGKLNDDAELLLDAMILGLQSMADNEEYNQYIDLSFKEV